MNPWQRMLGRRAAPDPFERAMAAARAGDDHAARLLFTQAANAKAPGAAFNLAIMLDKGRGGPADQSGAVSWYRVAADDGDIDACVHLATMLEHGIGVAAQMSAAIVLLDRAATGGDVHAMARLGVAYADGDGVNTDLDAAQGWLGKAADAGHAGAAYRVAMFADGAAADSERARGHRSLRASRERWTCCGD